jgi:hypothetical protein
MGPGGISAWPSARPASRPISARQWARREDGAMGAGPHASEGRGKWRQAGEWRSVHGEEEPSTGDPVLGGRGGGIARARVGDHDGGVKLAGGNSGRPVHGEVVGSRGDKVVGEAYGAR